MAFATWLQGVKIQPADEQPAYPTVEPGRIIQQTFFFNLSSGGGNMPYNLKQGPALVPNFAPFILCLKRKHMNDLQLFKKKAQIVYFGTI